MRTKLLLFLGIALLFNQCLFSQTGWTDGGTTVYTTTNTDKVGIGTATATSILDIRPAQGQAQVYFSSASNAYPSINMGGSSTTVSGLFQRITTGSSFYFGSDSDTGGYIFRGKGVTNIGSGRLYINSSQGGSNQGAVGIGTTNPLSKLHVIGSSRFANSTTGTIGYVDLIPEGSGTTPTSIEIVSGGTATSTQIDFKGYANNTDDFRGRIKYTDGTGFAFQVNETATDKVVITEGGLVGIGTTPASGYILDMVGANARLSYNANNFLILSSIPGQMSMVGDGSGPRLAFTYNYAGSTTPDGQIVYTDADGMSISTGGYTNIRMRIKTDGKIIMGDPSTVTTPTGYLLYVDGGILCEKVKVALCCTTDWSDFVFDPNYEMLPLDSVEKFVNANCHLPGVPSADEIVKEGIDVAKMDALLLQKIEELTLYMIQLRKENDELKSEIEELKKK